MPRILHEPIGPPVAAHLDERNHVDEQARPLARNETDVEEIDLGRNLCQHGRDGVSQQIKTRHLAAAEVDQALRALGLLQSRGADRRSQTRRTLASIQAGIVHDDPLRTLHSLKIDRSMMMIYCGNFELVVRLNIDLCAWNYTQYTLKVWKSAGASGLDESRRCVCGLPAAR